jgi:hypothetical protein
VAGQGDIGQARDGRMTHVAHSACPGSTWQPKMGHGVEQRPAGKALKCSGKAKTSAVFLTRNTCAVRTPGALEMKTPSHQASGMTLKAKLGSMLNSYAPERAAPRCDSTVGVLLFPFFRKHGMVARSSKNLPDYAICVQKIKYGAARRAAYPP